MPADQLPRYLREYMSEIMFTRRVYKKKTVRRGSPLRKTRPLLRVSFHSYNLHLKTYTATKATLHALHKIMLLRGSHDDDGTMKMKVTLMNMGTESSNNGNETQSTTNNTHTHKVHKHNDTIKHWKRPFH